MAELEEFGHYGPMKPQAGRESRPSIEDASIIFESRSAPLFSRGKQAFCDGPCVSLSVIIHISHLTVCQCHTSHHDHPTSNSCFALD